MKNDDGKPDIEIVRANIQGTYSSRVIGYTIHPRVWHRLFAAAATNAGHAALTKLMKNMQDVKTGGDPDANRRIVAGSIARDSVRIADALLAAMGLPVDGAEDKS